MKEENGIQKRFQGEEGKSLLLEAIKKQDIISQDEALASVLANVGNLITFNVGKDIVTQGKTDNDVYFLISGEAAVFVNDRFVAARNEGTCIGEMAAIDAAAPRSATVRAKTEVVALKIDEANFRKSLEAHPRAYRHLAVLLAQRLRQRSAFHQPPNPQPVLFIGSSVEALSIANEIQAGLKHDKIDAVIWTNGVFGPGGIAVESLCHMARGADFAAFVISPDDKVMSRENDLLAPRDNVIFELGLFMGVLDSKRTFLIKEHSSDVKIPSDLLGIAPVTYVMKGGNFKASMGPVCHELRTTIEKLGVR